MKLVIISALLMVLNWTVNSQSGSGGCTMHMYLSQDKVNGACGEYYAQVPSSVNGGFITAWRDLPGDNKAGCGVCIKVTSTKTSKSTHVLVVDRGGAMGLDLSQTAIESIDPGWATAGNTPCSWEVVASSNCQGASSNPSVGGSQSPSSTAPSGQSPSSGGSQSNGPGQSQAQIPDQPQSQIQPGSQQITTSGSSPEYPGQQLQPNNPSQGQTGVHSESKPSSNGGGVGQDGSGSQVGAPNGIRNPQDGLAGRRTEVGGPQGSIGGSPGGMVGHQPGIDAPLGGMGGSQPGRMMGPQGRRMMGENHGMMGMGRRHHGGMMGYRMMGAHPGGMMGGDLRGMAGGFAGGHMGGHHR